MLKQYLSCCRECIHNKNDGADWCKFPEWCDIHLSNGSVFTDIVQLECHVDKANSVDDIEMVFGYNQPDKERRQIIVRAGDIIAVVVRHCED